MQVAKHTEEVSAPTLIVVQDCAFATAASPPRRLPRIDWHLEELRWFANESAGEMGERGSGIYEQLCGGTTQTAAADDLTSLERETVLRAAARQRPIWRTLNKMRPSHYGTVIARVYLGHARSREPLYRRFGEWALVVAYLNRSLNVPKGKSSLHDAALVARAKSAFSEAMATYLELARGEFDGH